MTPSNINLIKNSLEEFKLINLEELFATLYPDSGELGNIVIGRYSVSEFTTFTKRFFEQLEVEINNGNGLVLPFMFANPEFGQADLLNEINSLLTSIKAKEFSSSENYLAWLITYQLQNGFYNKSQYKLHSVNVIETKKTQDIIELQIKDLNNLKNQYDAAIQTLEIEKKQLSDYKTQKENELLQIANNLETTNINNNTIQNLLTTSTQAQTRIDLILGEIIKGNQKVEDITLEMEKTIAKSKGEFSEFLASLSETEIKYKNLYTDFDNKLVFVQGKYDYFTERNTYLDNLIGREVGASLFETFKQRKIELSSPLKFWQIDIATMTVVTLFGIFAIFTNLFGLIKSSNANLLSWELIVVNAIKSSPFIFLLYYTIAQYNKERNFQEEYAFKSAVALTINAYADVLKESKAKDELILNAVYGIYRSPIYNKVKVNKELNSVLDVLKDAIDKGTGLFSKSK